MSLSFQDILMKFSGLNVEKPSVIVLKLQKPSLKKMMEVLDGWQLSQASARPRGPMAGVCFWRAISGPFFKVFS